MDKINKKILPTCAIIFKKNIFFIEDCTHNIFNKDVNLKYFNNKKIFKFASIKKYLPFPVGAINNIEK